MERRGAAAQREPHPEAEVSVDTASGRAHDLGMELLGITETLVVVALPRPTLFPVNLR